MPVPRIAPHALTTAAILLSPPLLHSCLRLSPLTRGGGGGQLQQAAPPTSPRERCVQSACGETCHSRAAATANVTHTFDRTAALP
jgi:hypothetical protein